MGLRELKIELNKMEKTEIIKMVSELYKKVPMAKNYLDIFTNGEVDGLIKKYQREIEVLVYPLSHNATFKDAEARKLIKTIRKMKIAELTVALELHYVDCCLGVIEDFGYWDESYYAAVDRMFYSATKGITENSLEAKYDKLIADLVSRSYEFGLDFEY